MPSLQFSMETVDTILDDEFVTSRDGGFRRFLVKWYGRPDSDATWIQDDDIHHLDSSMLDCYLSFHSSESSFGFFIVGLLPFLSLFGVEFFSTRRE